MHTDLYIYYRVPVAHAAVLQVKVAEMQQSIAQEYGIVAKLKRRPEAKNDRHTWMEVYYDVPAGFDAIASNAALQTGVSVLIDGERHTEIFLDCSTCA
ncbi:DUF4936 family protein [Noviherbaspirillum massiliense]|uniref:DUF4936 family protein n=1 Tax=Noviherbaspirillum massiliense TaxID=1465823 RepID=UPI0002D64C90|nr:DUF4936 family protein [Noviherbaspirillum massiliense]